MRATGSYTYNRRFLNQDYVAAEGIVPAQDEHAAMFGLMEMHVFKDSKFAVKADLEFGNRYAKMPYFAPDDLYFNAWTYSVAMSLDVNLLGFIPLMRNSTYSQEDSASDMTQTTCS